MGVNLKVSVTEVEVNCTQTEDEAREGTSESSAWQRWRCWQVKENGCRC